MPLKTAYRIFFAFLLCIVLSTLVYLRGLVYVGWIGLGAAAERSEWIHQDGTRTPLVSEPKLSVKIGEPNKLFLTHRTAYVGYALCVVGFIESALGLLLFFLKRGNRFFSYLFGGTAGLAILTEIADIAILPSLHPLKIIAQVAGFFAIVILSWYSVKFFRNSVIHAA